MWAMEIIFALQDLELGEQRGSRKSVCYRLDTFLETFLESVRRLIHGMRSVLYSFAEDWFEGFPKRTQTNFRQSFSQP